MAVEGSSVPYRVTADRSRSGESQYFKKEWHEAMVIPLSGRTDEEVTGSLSRQIKYYPIFRSILEQRIKATDKQYGFVYDQEDLEIRRAKVLKAMMRLYDGANNPYNTESMLSIRAGLEEDCSPEAIQEAELYLEQHKGLILESGNSTKGHFVRYTHRVQGDNVELRPATTIESAQLQSKRAATTVGTIFAREGVTYGIGLALLPIIHASPLGEFAREHPVSSALLSDALFYATLAGFVGPSIVKSIKSDGESLDGIATNVHEVAERYNLNPQLRQTLTYLTAIFTQLGADIPAHSVLLSNLISEQHFPILHNAGNEYFLSISIVGAAVNVAQSIFTSERLKRKKKNAVST